MPRFFQLGNLVSVAILSLCFGCSKSPIPRRMPSPTLQFPFQHPAAQEARKIFLTLPVYSEDDYRKMSRRDRYLWDVKWFEAEVMNGGVDQYFYNSAGDHSEECLEALKAIGATQTYDLLKQACALFPGGRPNADHEVRQRQLHELVGEKNIDDLISGEIEVDLYQRMLSYYHDADPKK